MAMLTWDQIIKIEPGLAKLYDEASAVRDPGGASFCANAVWYGYGREDGNGGLRRKVIALVGWDSDHEELRTPQAYDLAYQKIYDQLPACRNCGCM